MEKSFIPESYEQWRHCIIVECGLKLTADFIEERIKSLQDTSVHYTQQFIKLYGEEHHQKVLGWFMKERDAR